MGDYQFPNNKPSRLRRQKRRDKRLHEEVIECRRWGGGDSNKKYRTKGCTKRLQKERLSDAIPFRAPICEGDERTSFDDNLEPLLRYLQQSVGRRWNDVYAELSQKLDRSTVTGLHVFQHLEWYIRPFLHEEFYPENFTSRKTGVGVRFRIHPETGVLLTEKKENDHTGLFPRKARFKMEKEREKARRKFGKPALRQPSEKVSQNPSHANPNTLNFSQVTALLADILFKRLQFNKKNEWFNPCWDKLTQEPFVLKKGGGNEEYTLTFYFPQFGLFDSQQADEGSFPIVSFGFYITSYNRDTNSKRGQYFYCKWRLSGEKGWPVEQISLK